ncbi:MULTISPECIES: isochorismatase family protein [unclassified Rhizobium]|uniref:isochorismatase family protein n=1 Tax=unclassified Rhizobium TaxID=2613769 RepID=UPI001ADB035B|nr:MULTISPECIES: isochorismatase family protein [unclassified Rhizobium]MBO9123716.1 isochorismatase family protein [Rhizobium sp. 16-488-2b]MBO9174248.1 isochorismatase family protein [Rhizobium sp. 16-488-2a]
MRHALKSVVGAIALASVSTLALAQDRPADIVSSIKDGVQALQSTPAQARQAGRFAYDKPTPENSVMLFIDHQVGLMASVRDFKNASAYKGNVVALAQMAKALKIPVLLTTSNAQWQNGDMLPELKETFPDQPIIRRTGIINAYEDPTFRKALLDLLKKTGRTHIIISGVTIGTCVAFPTLSLINDGYQVFPVIDASGAWSDYEADAAMSRMSGAGAQLETVYALGAELQADWKLPSGNDMLAPFVNGLPEYGWVVQNFWSNANTRTVPDPFGMVK